MIIAILISISCLFARLIMLKRMIGMPLGIYVKMYCLTLHWYHLCPVFYLFY